LVDWSQVLKATYDYIALNSKFYAKKTIRDIIQKATIVAVNPELGRNVPELSDQTVREIFIYSYRIIYQTTKNGVKILTIVHGHQNLNSDQIPT
jgi:toxin ParE1/3/4